MNLPPLSAASSLPPSSAAAARRDKRADWTHWLLARDPFLIGLSALLSLLVSMALVRWPKTIVWAWLLWLWLIEGPHLVATFLRTADPPGAAVPRRFRPLLLRSTWLYLPGFVALGLGQILSTDLPFRLFLLIGALLSIYHSVRQTYGFVAISYVPEKPNDQRKRYIKQDKTFLSIVFPLAFCTYLLVQPMNRLMLFGPPAQDSLWTSAPLHTGLALLLAVLCVGYVVRGFVSVRPVGAPRPWRPFALVLLLVGHFALNLFWLGQKEPLWPKPATLEQAFLATALFGGMLHGIPYMVLCIRLYRLRKINDEMTHKVRNSSAFLIYGALAAIAAGYLMLNLLRGASPIASPWSEASLPGQLFLSLYWGLFFQHYYLDAYIWRVSSDPALRQDLNALVTKR